MLLIYIPALFVDTIMSGVINWVNGSYITVHALLDALRAPGDAAGNGFFVGIMTYLGPKIALFVILLAVGIFVFFHMEKLVQINMYVSDKDGGNKKVNVVKIIGFILLAVVVIYALFVAKYIYMIYRFE